MLTTTRAWDDLWQALKTAGVDSIQGEWGPINADGINWGEQAAFVMAELQETRLSRHQILLIAELVRVTARAATGECGIL